jgi:hypothetical protein
MKGIAKMSVGALMLVAVTACVKQPTLEEKLASATGPERQRVAYEECLKRARYPVPGGHDGDYRGHESRQWALCDAMQETNKPTEK